MDTLSPIGELAELAIISYLTCLVREERVDITA